MGNLKGSIETTLAERSANEMPPMPYRTFRLSGVTHPALSIADAIQLAENEP
jgi:hypothetical protein